MSEADTTTETTDGETSMGLDPNVAGALAYLLGPFTGILFYVLEDENEFVRFHAMQSILVGVVGLVFVVGINVIPILGFVVSLIAAPVMFLLFLFLMYKAYSGEEWEFPVLGEQARNYI